MLVVMFLQVILLNEHKLRAAFCCSLTSTILSMCLCLAVMQFHCSRHTTIAPLPTLHFLHTLEQTRPKHSMYSRCTLKEPDRADDHFTFIFYLILSFIFYSCFPFIVPIFTSLSCSSFRSSHSFPIQSALLKASPPHNQCAMTPMSHHFCICFSSLSAGSERQLANSMISSSSLPPSVSGISKELAELRHFVQFPEEIACILTEQELQLYQRVG